MEKTLEGAKELLNSILLTDNTPILFLGAGFSCGASNKANAMDGCKLKEYIYDTLAKDKIGPEDEEEVKGYDLRKLSDIVYIMERQNYIIYCMKCISIPDRQSFMII